MLTHRFLSYPPPILLRPQCPRRFFSLPSVRSSSFLPSRIFPSSLTRHRSPQTAKKTVRKTKPLPISPTASRLRRKSSRIILYTLAFLAPGTITYTTLQPDNFVNHVFHGIVRCSRVTVTLIHCVYDYRMTLRRQRQRQRQQDAENSGGVEEGEMSECHLRCARRTLKVFEKNGGIYIKLGQHLAALSYLIPIVRPPLSSFLKFTGMGVNYVNITRCMSTNLH